jgi:hypothetical protein
LTDSSTSLTSDPSTGVHRVNETNDERRRGVTHPGEFFTLDGLRTFIQSAPDPKAYIRFRDWRCGGILLRFDVDFDLRSAPVVARTLADLEVPATFFVLTSADTYNVTSARSRARLAEIASLGFEVALHFDPTVYPDADEKTLADRMNAERHLLAGSAGVEVRSISLHNPSVHGTYPMFDGLVNAYDPALFVERYYLSDSRRSFRGKDPFAFLAAATDGIAGQIVMHPENYITNGGIGYQGMVRRHLVATCDKIDETFEVNSTYVSERGGASSRSLNLRAGASPLATPNLGWLYA